MPYKMSTRNSAGGASVSSYVPTPGAVRQTILSGATDSNGVPIFLNYVYKDNKHQLFAYASEKAPLVLSFSIGTTEKVVTVTKSLYLDITSYINSGSSYVNYYIYADLDTATNSVSLGATTVKPNYGYKSKTDKKIPGTYSLFSPPGAATGSGRGWVTGYGSSVHSSYPTSGYPNACWIMTQVTGASVAGNWFAFDGVTAKVKTIGIAWYYMPDVWKIQWSPDSTNGSNGTWNDIMTISGGNFAGYAQISISQPALIQLPDYGASGTHMIRFYAVQSNSTAFSGYNWQFLAPSFHSTEITSYVSEKNSIPGEGSNWLRRDTCIYSASQGAADANAGWTCLFDKRQSWYWYAGAAGAQWFGVQNVPNTNPVRKIRIKGHDSNSYHAYATLQWSPDGTTWNDIPGATQMQCNSFATTESTYCLWYDVIVPEYTPVSGGGTHRFRAICTQVPSGSNHYAYTNGWHVYEAEIHIASDYYSIPDGTFYSPDGTQLKRVYIGEYRTYSTYVDSLVSYAIMGKYESSWGYCGVNSGIGWRTGIHDAVNNNVNHVVYMRAGDYGIVTISGNPTAGVGASNNTSTSPLTFQMQAETGGYIYMMTPNYMWTQNFNNGTYNNAIDYCMSCAQWGTTYNTQNNAQTAAFKCKANRGW